MQTITDSRRKAGWLTFTILILIMLRAVHHGPATLYDGKTYMATGLRYLAGDVNSLYEPIDGAAAFGYQPQTAAFFAAFTLKGEAYGFVLLRLVNGFCLFLTFLMFCKFIAADKLRAIGRVFFCFCFYWFIIDESLYIGQIDLLLLFLLSGYVFLMVKGKAFISGLILGFVIQFKPHFALLAAPAILHPQFLPFAFLRTLWQRGRLKEIPLFHSSTVFAGSLVISIVGFIGYFILAKGLTLKAYLLLFQRFSDITGGYAFSSCCNNVNNSLRSVILNLFSAHPQTGRWSPVPWSDTGKYNIKLFVVENDTVLYAVYITLLLLAITALIITVWKYQTSGAGGRRGLIFFTCFSALPTISPAFWHTHSLYILPVWIYFAIMIADTDPARKFKILFFVFGGIFVGINNYEIIGGYLADITLIVGTYYFLHLTLFVFFLLNTWKIIREEALRPV